MIVWCMLVWVWGCREYWQLVGGVCWWCWWTLCSTKWSGTCCVKACESVGLGNDVPEYWQLAVGLGIGWGQLGGPGAQVNGGQVHAGSFG